MGELTQEKCNICSTPKMGTYCHNCGQKDTGKKLSMTTVIDDFVSNIFSLQKSGLATLFLVITHPLKVIQSYWNGYRRYYKSPSRLVVYASLLIGLHIYFHNNLIFGLQFTDDPQGFFIVLFLMLLTFSSYLTYFKQKRTLAEHLVANVYLLCTWSIVMIILYELIHFLVGRDAVISYSFLMVLVVLIIAYTSRVMHTSKSWLLRILIGFKQFIIMSLILAALLGVLVIFGNLEIQL